ncbi:hypothetical protein PT974_08748 [Cladobotryum mycophilum]|uniref:Uncharacterized protein n=1 Tax=Cladobotryum mycophilum TaxID=491253 RepID=A0ABR0SF96_9HYPO
MPMTKPKLGKLTTPVTSTFPSEVHSANTATPRSAVTFTFKPDSTFINTPISPPLAYTDFLSKAISVNSPALASGETTPDSAPTSAASDKSDRSSTSGSPSPTSSASSSKVSSPASASAIPPSPFAAPPLPMSAPPTGANCFPSLKLPPSPAISYLDSPMSARLIGSPFSARSIHSPFDWEVALKTRLAEQKKQKSSRTSVRHIREVVTRTVTYTPKIEAAPRGKRRKVE